MKCEIDTLDHANRGEAKQLNFEYGFRPLYHFSRAVGFWPFSIRHNSNGAIQSAHISRLDGVWFAISICCNLSTILYFIISMLDDLNPNEKTIFTFRILYTLFRVMSLSIGAVGIILDMLNRYTLVNILKKFIIFDNEVRLHDLYYFLPIFIIFLLLICLEKCSLYQVAKFGIHFNYKNDYRRACVHLIIPTMLALTILMISSQVFHLYARGSIFFVLCFNATILRSVLWFPILVSFTTLIRSLCKRFATLNYLLRFHQ